MSERFDLDQFIKVIAMVGSAHDGEALVEARQADRLLRRADLSWDELLKPHHELTIAVDAALGLSEENEAPKAELEQYRAAVKVRPNGGDWRPVGDPREQARWALALADRGLVRLNKFERSFLGTVSRWRGELTERQQPIWEDHLPEIARRSGRTPP
jgi:hypothetical protein